MTEGGAGGPPPGARTPHVIPVGPHVIPLPPAARQVLEQRGTLPSPLTGTRVWIERRRDELYLHLGDVEAPGGS